MSQFPDVSFDVLDKLRRAGINEDAMIILSRLDAGRLVGGIGRVNRDLQGPETIGAYEGAQDHHGTLLFALDESLPRGVARIEVSRRSPIMMSVVDVIPWF